jgi:hypothetical protein
MFLQTASSEVEGEASKAFFNFLLEFIPSALLLRPKLMMDLINLPTGKYYISEEKVYFINCIIF